MIDPAKVTIPTLPTVAIRLLELYDDPEVELSEVVELLRTDPAITAKFIKAANSPAYGVGREISDLRQAVSLLGKSVVAPLALSFSLSEKSMQMRAAADLFRQYWLQAIVQAMTAELLARQYEKSQIGEWFVAGLLSSIGRLALINHDPEKYAQVLELAEASRLRLEEAELQLLGTTTVDLSVDMLRAWKLPQRWIDAAANQILLVEKLEELLAREMPHMKLFIGVATASAVGSYFCRNCQGESLVHIVHLMEEGFGATEDEVHQLLAAVRERLNQVAHLFDVRCASLGSATQLISRAMQHLAGIAVAHAMAAQREEGAAELLRQGALQERIERLMRRSTIDALTGAYNRGYFDERFAEEVAAAAAASKVLGILFADVDHFKSINDTHGHLAGDEVLRQVADALQSAIRSSDFLARYGGEEFVVLFHDPHPDELAALGERLRARIEQREFMYAGTRIPVTISIGAAAGRPVAAIDRFGERLLAAADRAMYEAKRRGRNRVVVASPSDLPAFSASAVVRENAVPPSCELATV